MISHHNNLAAVVRSSTPRAAWVVALISATVLGACSEDGDTPVVAEELTEIQADNVVYGMTQILTSEGIREGRITADTAFFFQDSAAVHLRALTLEIFDEGGRTRAEVNAERGRLETATSTMVARGDVVLTIPGQGREITTPELHYSSPDDRIWSDSATVMRQDDDVQCGTSFRSDLEFRNVYIENMKTVGCGG